jgi:hypothetical protein
MGLGLTDADAGARAEGTSRRVLTKIAQHVEVGLLRLAPAYWGKPRIGAVLAAVLREIQTLEDAIWDQFTLQHIDTADRPRLIVMGKLIGQDPSDFDVESLRTVIKARGLANRSKGTGPGMGRVLTALVGEQNFYFTWVEPAVIYIAALTPLTDVQVKMIQSVLPHGTAAGVSLQMTYSDESNYFKFGDPWGAYNWGTVREI